jgi:hypothetical protein
VLLFCEGAASLLLLWCGCFCAVAALKAAASAKALLFLRQIYKMGSCHFTENPVKCE